MSDAHPEDYRHVSEADVHWPDRTQWLSLGLLLLGLAALVVTVQLLRGSPQVVVTSPTESTIAGPSGGAVDTQRYFCGPVTAGTGLDDEGFDVGGQYGARGGAEGVNESPVRTLADADSGRLTPYNLNDTVATAACSRARSARAGHAIETGLLGVVLLGASATLGVRRRVGLGGA